MMLLLKREQVLLGLTFFEQVGYWRKANQIHNWFVENCQEGIDECQYSFVSEEQIKELLATCKKVVELQKQHDIVGGVTEELEELLPTQGGFFFGSTDYDVWYFQDVEGTIKILEKVIEETDFETQQLFYQSSW